LLATFLSCVLSLAIRSADAQSTTPSYAEPSAQSATTADDDRALQPAEPDYRLVNLPTTLRLPLHGSNFEITHRFNGNLRNGSFGDQASSLFGIDDGAVIGLEYRYAVLPHLQASVYRTTFDRTFQFYGKYDAAHQSGSMPLSVSALVSVEGADNFQRDREPALGASVSRTIDDAVAVYATPIWVHNSAAASGITRDTFVLGIGGRARIRPTVYVVGEISPRLGGYTPGDAEFAFGIEKRAGLHMFQLDVGNSQGTTFGQLARGGFPHSLYLGFNLARKFF
jgi:hypothetical protein